MMTSCHFGKSELMKRGIICRQSGLRGCRRRRSRPYGGRGSRNLRGRPRNPRPSTGSSRRRIFPAEASIHILRVNTIFCGGSSATGSREHNDFYVQDMEENGGDIWLTLSRFLEHTITHANDGGFMGMITKLIESKTFFDLFKESVKGEKGEDHMECKRS